MSIPGGKAMRYTPTLEVKLRSRDELLVCCTECKYITIVLLPVGAQELVDDQICQAEGPAGYRCHGKLLPAMPELQAAHTCGGWEAVLVLVETDPAFGWMRDRKAVR